MTLLGKILAVMVTLFALVWMFFNVQSYVARTNWKAEADKYRERADKALKAREDDYRAGQADKDALAKALDKTRKEVSDRDDRLKTLSDENTKLDANVKAMATTLDQTKQAKDQTDANLAATIAEGTRLRAQYDAAQDRLVLLVVAKEKAEADRLQAQIERNTAQGRAEQLAKTVEDLGGQVASLKRNGGKLDPVTDSIGGRPAVVPEGLRGTVTAVNEPYVSLSVGLDAGLTVGSTLSIYRLAGGGKYLGQVVVSNVYPKEAVATFRPATGRDPTRLAADERPKVGDEVSKLGQ